MSKARDPLRAGRLQPSPTRLVVPQDKLKVGHHGERSLESFCNWQYHEYGGARYLGNNHVPGGRDDIPPVDTGVLVTR